VLNSEGVAALQALCLPRTNRVASPPDAGQVRVHLPRVGRRLQGRRRGRCGVSGRLRAARRSRTGRRSWRCRVRRTSPRRRVGGHQRWIRSARIDGRVHGGDACERQVTIQNVTPLGSQPLSPPLVVVHPPRADVWSLSTWSARSAGATSSTSTTASSGHVRTRQRSRRRADASASGRGRGVARDHRAVGPARDPPWNGVRPAVSAGRVGVTS
jgi:hypothetical protein